MVIQPQYFVAFEFTDGLAGVAIPDATTKQAKWGLIDKTGSIPIQPKYDQASSFSNGLAVVTLNSKSGYIDKTGNGVVPLGKYMGVQDLSDGLGAVWDGANGGLSIIPAM